MKALNIISIILAIAIIPISIYYIEETSYARWSDFDLGGGYSSYYSYGSSAKEYTFEASLIVLLFLLYFLFVNIFNLAKVKTTSSKVIGIIGLSLIGLGFLFNLLVLSSGGGASFDEVGGVWIFAGLLMIAFSIVFLVQTIKFSKRNKVEKSAGIINEEIV